MFSFAVSRARSFVKFWMPVIIWMAVIFVASGQAGSVRHTSRVLGPIIHWLFPSLSEQRLGEIVFSIRKCSHAVEYAILAVLLWRARRKPFRHDHRPWYLFDTMVAFGIAALYAVSDEIHQTFVASRQGSFWDVLLDSAGAALGLLLFWRIGKIFRKW